MDLDRNAKFACDGAQECTFSGVAFDAVHFCLRSVGDRHRNNNAGKPRAGTEIKPTIGAKARLLNEKAVVDVSFPNVGKVLVRSQVGDFSPTPEHLNEVFQPI